MAVVTDGYTLRASRPTRFGGCRASKREAPVASCRWVSRNTDRKPGRGALPGAQARLSEIFASCRQNAQAWRQSSSNSAGCSLGPQPIRRWPGESRGPESPAFLDSGSCGTDEIIDAHVAVVAEKFHSASTARDVLGGSAGRNCQPKEPSPDRAVSRPRPIRRGAMGQIS